MTKLEPIHFSDYDRYTPFFHGQNHRLCVYSLPSLIAWHTREYHPVAGVYNDAFVAGAEFATQKQNRHLILPVSGNGDFPPDKLHRMAREFGFDKYWFVRKTISRPTAKRMWRRFLRSHGSRNTMIMCMQPMIWPGCVATNTPKNAT